MEQLQTKIAKLTGITYSYFLLNDYRRGDCIAEHSDNQEGWLPETPLSVIALYYDQKKHQRSLTLRYNKEKCSFNVPMKHGYLASMISPTNTMVKHCYKHLFDFYGRQSISVRAIEPKADVTTYQDPKRDVGRRVEHIEQIPTTRNARIIFEEGSEEVFLATCRNYKKMWSNRVILSLKEC